MVSISESWYNKDLQQATFIAPTFASVQLETRRNRSNLQDFHQITIMSDSVMHAVAGGAGGMIAMVSAVLESCQRGLISIHSRRP